MEKSEKKLGTFLGVFTPTILTILGVIMYMRVGWVVGHVGLRNALLLITLANCITLITTLSFSSVATNIKVGAGGAYYIISRSLGLEIGGAIGIPLFLSQTFSVTLYAFGLAEALTIVLPDINIQMVAALIVITVAAIAYFGAEFALKMQLPLMVAIGISILFLIIGVFLRDGSPVLFTENFGEVSFFEAFGVFFPAVTGVMTGLGMSGDLKDPSKAIPSGSISATFVGFAVYITLPSILLLGATPEILRSEQNIWPLIAPLGLVVILPGLFGAIFSSAIGSVLTAPRTLTALSDDLILKNKKLRAIFTGKKGNITNLFITLFLALGAVLIGDLNAVAPIVSMFFLTVYGMVNLVAAIESFSAEPSWRPKFKTPWLVNLVGFLACISVMFLIGPIETLIAIVVEIFIYFMLMRKETKAKWGDARRGFWESLIRKSLIRLADIPEKPRNWRPHILVFSSDPQKNLNLVKFGNHFCLDKGLVTVSKGIIASEETTSFELKKEFLTLKKFFKNENLLVFPEIEIVDDFSEGIFEVSQANGFAGLNSNTVLIPLHEKHLNVADSMRIMHKLAKINKSLIIGKVEKDFDKLSHKANKLIHVWWGGLQNNGDLMLLLAHLLSLNTSWRNTTIKLMSIVRTKEEKEMQEEMLNQLIPDFRIKATPEVITNDHNKNIFELISEVSQNADVVIRGLKMPEKGEEEALAKGLLKFAEKLDCVFYVKNFSLFTGKLLDN